MNLSPERKMDLIDTWYACLIMLCVMSFFFSMSLSVSEYHTQGEIKSVYGYVICGISGVLLWISIRRRLGYEEV